ncbi:hypothetical protein ACOZ38_14570 [Sphaerisporangium viridialbum]|uniref:hypothetical protein n=1 Tax=Sphaerisporangium viridialbum TaxID=46189 RepID=UPI003C73F5F8
MPRDGLVAVEVVALVEVDRAGELLQVDRECDVYVYLNNDPGGAAVRNAERFAELARTEGRPLSRTPAGVPEAGVTT